MLIQRLYLRNFRVYEDELDLELPPGLVGIYGPNGAGKSTLLEAILFCLWGKARTTKEHIRSAGVGGECVVEVQFEHEGHLYLVRRMLKGINAAISVEAHCDGSLISTGIRDVEAYVESVLGLDDSAFRASVFTEQKQLAAFSNHPPHERRKLVLQLLGITPLDAARDAARKDARDLNTAHEKVRGLLPDVVALEEEAGDAETKAAAAELAAADEVRAAEAAELRAGEAQRAFEASDRARQEYDSLVIEGRAARQELDALTDQITQQRDQLTELEGVAERLAELEPGALMVDEADRVLRLISTAAGAATALARVEVGPQPPAPDDDGLAAAQTRSGESRERLAAVEALTQAASAELGRARDAAARSSSLSGEADCPVCGQALGDAFETVQAHRAKEVAEAQARAAELTKQQKALAREATAAQGELRRLTEEVAAARRARDTWAQADGQRRDAARVLDEVWTTLLVEFPETAEGSGEERAAHLARLQDEGRRRLEAARAAGAEVQRLQGRLHGRPALEKSLAAIQEKGQAAQSRVEALRDKVRQLGFDKAALEQAAAARDAALVAGRNASTRATEATLLSVRERERAVASAGRLADGREKHAQMAGLESEVRHVGRVADLLSEFRNTVVATVGPRLAVQAADLFGELTDHEYEKLDVDPETYQLRISDGGQMYGLERFSGSEVDLANLALRVAISEHIHFQSGGSVGLLVLDEVFGPLDEDRKQRMLLALERLRGRFRQVLVVTHDNEIKEQLPNAIEVIKLPGRRATARLIGD